MLHAFPSLSCWKALTSHNTSSPELHWWVGVAVTSGHTARDWQTRDQSRIPHIESFAFGM